MPKINRVTFPNNSDIYELIDYNKILIGTINAGDTSITFTNDAITDTARFEYFCNVPKVALQDESRSGNSLTLTIAEQEQDVQIDVIITEDVHE